MGLVGIWSAGSLVNPGGKTQRVQIIIIPKKKHA